MGIFGFGKKKEVKEINIDYKPALSDNVIDLLNMNVNEAFKGEVEQKKIRFPTELGEEHPFDFKKFEELYKKFGFFTAVVDKYIDFIVGPGFYVTCDDEGAKEIIENFMQEVGFDTLLRQWCKEMLIKGNGFLEIGGDGDKGIEGMKILNANNMYVQRDEKGRVEGYNQYKGAFNRFAKQKIISFTPKQIAHIPFNLVGDCAYGIGIGYSALCSINYILQQEKDLHQIMNRKANSPLHAKIGKVDGQHKIIPKATDVATFGQKMENMTNKTEWATDALVDLKVVDFGNIGEKFSAVLEHDIQMLFYIFQIPAVIMGMARVPEGLAKVQMEAFQRRIQSIQQELEKVVEEKIFKRVLNANGLDVHVEFEWGTPSVMEVEGRLKLISEIIKSPVVSMAMKDILEDEFVNLLKLDKDKWEDLKTEEEEEREREEERPQPIVPGQNKNFPQRAPTAAQKAKPVPQNQSTPTNKTNKKVKPKKVSQKYVVRNGYELEKECPHCEESWNTINDIEEWLGFKYKDYVKQIVANIRDYNFDDLLALTANEEMAGYLSRSQIEKLKKILEDGFKKRLSILDITKEVESKIGLKDLYRLDENGNLKKGASGLPILARSKEKRAVGIVRSEITRLANLGAIDYYKENGIERVTWVASYGSRTCPICEELNGQIFEIGKIPTIPVHPLCRCTVTPLVGLK